MTPKKKLRGIGAKIRRFDRIQFDWRRWREGMLDGFTRLISGITNARVSYPNGDGKTARDAWRKNSRCLTKFRDKYRAQERTNERERTSSEPGRGGVSFSVASDHRDRDRCDQPPRSRCRGQHHRSVLSFSLRPSVILSHSLSPSLARPLFAFRPPST